jgi:hypothetical protein
MQAWKSFDNFDRISPVSALSLTTKEWGVDRFPSNLVGINGTLAAARQENRSIPVSYDDPYWWSYGRTYGSRPSSFVLPVDAKSCEEEPVDGCWIVIEFIGKTTAGNTGSPISPLSAGIAFFLALLSSLIITAMGQEQTRVQGAQHHRRRPDPLDAHVQQHYNAPLPTQQQQNRRANNNNGGGGGGGRGRTGDTAVSSDSNIQREIQRCATLLRQMYALDLEIWGTDGGMLDIVSRDEKRRRSDAIFDEVRRIGYSWVGNSGIAWTQDEHRVIQEICVAIRDSPRMRGGR